MAVATHGQIVWHFLTVLAERNWKDARIQLSDHDVPGTDTYINNVPLEVDLDYYGGYLLELVDRESYVVTYLAVAVFHGPRLDDDGDLISWRHDSMLMEENVGTFFDRTVDLEAACKWGVERIFGMIDAEASLQAGPP